jgi:hypothetical protein
MGKNFFGMFIIILFILISQQSDALIVISEIMYNPAGDDNNKEFIEVYSDGYQNLSNYIIEDSSSEDVLKPVYVYNNNYSLIIEDGFNYNGINASIYTVGATIGNNLNNDNDVIILRDTSNNILDLVSYSESFGANGNKSLERISTAGISNDRANWAESRYGEGTPGRENSVSDKDFSMISINEFLPDPLEDDDAAMPNGEWIELYNSANYNLDLSDLYFLDDFGHKILIDRIHVMENTIIEADKFLVVYTNGFSGFLNNDGDKIKLYHLNELVDEVSYDFSKEGTAWAKINETWLINKPTPNYKNEENASFLNSSIIIGTIYLSEVNKAKFGDEIRIRLNIYKGNTRKNSIQAWVEKNKVRVSKETKVNIYDKFVNHDLTIPIQLDPNCNNRFNNDRYKLIVEGLDTSDFRYFMIEGTRKSLCHEVEVEKEKEPESINVEFLEVPEEIELDKESVTKVRIDNNSTKPEDIEVWSYIYVGSVSLSGDREKNKIKMTLPKESSSTIELRNSLDEEDIAPGDYKLKIKIKKGDRKTTDDFTSTIRLLDEDVKKKETSVNNTKINLGNSLISGNLIYESSDLKTKNLGIYIFIIALLLIIIILLLRKSL